jgi:hypothetical protein
MGGKLELLFNGGGGEWVILAKIVPSGQNINSHLHIQILKSCRSYQESSTLQNVAKILGITTAHVHTQV